MKSNYVTWQLLDWRSGLSQHAHAHIIPYSRHVIHSPAHFQLDTLPLTQYRVTYKLFKDKDRYIEEIEQTTKRLQITSENSNQ